MLDKKLIEKIKEVCKINNPDLFDEFTRGVITDESLSDAYELIVLNVMGKSQETINRTTIASRCAVMCYKRNIG